jgi:putative endonuclease
LAHLQQQGLVLVQRNYRVAAGPSARAGEVDLIMRDSVTRSKQMRIIFAARHYLQRHCRVWPPCRFDVVAIDGDDLTWLVAAFDAG